MQSAAKRSSGPIIDASSMHNSLRKPQNRNNSALIVNKHNPAAQRDSNNNSSNNNNSQRHKRPSRQQRAEQSGRKSPISKNKMNNSHSQCQRIKIAMTLDEETQENNYANCHLDCGAHNKQQQNKQSYNDNKCQHHRVSSISRHKRIMTYDSHRFIKQRKNLTESNSRSYATTTITLFLFSIIIIIMTMLQQQQQVAASEQHASSSSLSKSSSLLRLKKSSDKLNSWLLKEVAPKVANRVLDNLFQPAQATGSASNNGNGQQQLSAATSLLSVLPVMSSVVAGQSKSTAPSVLEEQAQQQARNLVSSGFQVAQNLIMQEGRKMFGRAMDKQLNKLLQKTTTYSLSPSSREQQLTLSNNAHTNSNNNNNNNNSPWSLSKESSYDQIGSNSDNNQLDDNPLVLRAEHAQNVTSSPPPPPPSPSPPNRNYLMSKAQKLRQQQLLQQQQQHQYNVQQRNTNRAQQQQRHHSTVAAATTISNHNRQNGPIKPLQHAIQQQRQQQQSPYATNLLDSQASMGTGAQLDYQTASINNNEQHSQDMNIVRAPISSTMSSISSELPSIFSSAINSIISSSSLSSAQPTHTQQQQMHSISSSSSSPSSSGLLAAEALVSAHKAPPTTSLLTTAASTQQQVFITDQGDNKVKILANNRSKKPSYVHSTNHPNKSWYSTNRPNNPYLTNTGKHRNQQQQNNRYQQQQASTPSSTTSTTSSTTTTSTTTTSTTTESPPTMPSIEIVTQQLLPQHQTQATSDKAPQPTNKPTNSKMSSLTKTLVAAAATTARQSITSTDAIPTALGAPLYHLRPNYTSTSIMVPPKRATPLDLMRPNAKLAAQYIQKGIHSVSSTIFGRQQMNWARRLGLSSMLLSGLIYGVALLAGLPPNAPALAGLEALGVLGNKRRGGQKEPLIGSASGGNLFSEQLNKMTIQQQQQLLPFLDHLIKQEQSKQRFLLSQNDNNNFNGNLMLPLIQSGAQNLIERAAQPSHHSFLHHHDNGVDNGALVGRLVTMNQGIMAPFMSQSDQLQEESSTSNSWKLFNQAQQDTIRRRRKR